MVELERGVEGFEAEGLARGGSDGSARERGGLLPVRHPNHDFFVCDVMDAIPKDDMASMEHPIFALSTKPDTRIRKYAHNGVSVEVRPGAKGLATIHDKDILIYCISQLVAALNDGKKVSRTVELTAHHLLVSSNRRTDGRGYEALKEAFERLDSTRITTNIKTGGKERTEGFGLIESWQIVRETKSGRMSQVRVTLSDWVFNAIQGREVLTLHRDYFRLRKPIERRVYEIARKHCGQQDEWSISLELLHKKCGSGGSVREFRRSVKELADLDHLPDYGLTMDGDLARFVNRETMKGKPDREQVRFPLLQPETYHDARIVAPRYDVYQLERDWQCLWVDSGCPVLHDPDKAFIGFCKARYARNPNP